MFSLPTQVNLALRGLNAAGFEAYIVGGCVRDILLGTNPADFDITTSALPNQIKEVFEGFKTIDTGIKHGTVTVIVDGMPFEITTFRTETAYSDNRHPDRVIFTPNLIDDLSRRDFTVNAMAYNPLKGLVDMFGGREDLKAQSIRCVGDADTRFNEDALRIMRGLRFSSVLGFDIEKSTAQAIRKNKNLLLNVSCERIAAELKKLLCGKGVFKAITEYYEVLEIVLPEITGMQGFDQKNPHHIYDILKHTASAVENIPAQSALRLAALLHDCGKADCFFTDEKGIGHFYGHADISAKKADAALCRLKFDNATKERVVSIVKHHDMQIEPTEKSVKRALNKLTPQGFFDLMEMKKADTLALHPKCRSRVLEIDSLCALAEDIIAKKECFSLKDLAIKGDDLLAMGFAPGRELGRTLNMLLEAVINGDALNEKAKLIEYITKNQI